MEHQPPFAEDYDFAFSLFASEFPQYCNTQPVSLPSTAPPSPPSVTPSPPVGFPYPPYTYTQPPSTNMMSHPQPPFTPSPPIDFPNHPYSSPFTSPPPPTFTASPSAGFNSYYPTPITSSIPSAFAPSPMEPCNLEFGALSMADKELRSTSPASTLPSPPVLNSADASVSSCSLRSRNMSDRPAANMQNLVRIDDTGFSWHKCPSCKTEIRRDNWARHGKTHLKVKETFKCELCNKEFDSRKDSVDRHQQTSCPAVFAKPPSRRSRRSRPSSSSRSPSNSKATSGTLPPETRSTFPLPQAQAASRSLYSSSALAHPSVDGPPPAPNGLVVPSPPPAPQSSPSGGPSLSPQFVFYTPSGVDRPVRRKKQRSQPY